MIQALLVTICLAVFPYQGSSIILESGNVNDYEVVYPQKVQALPKGVQNPEQESKYEDTMQYEFQVNGEPVVLHLERNKGHFKHQGESYLIEPLKLSKSEAHAVYKAEHVEKEDETPKTCGNCHNACCDATTCKLKPGTECEDGECCQQCKFKGSKNICREAKHDCDIAERCTGQSAECPRDISHRNGKPCQNNEGYCYNGTCPTLTNQCIEAMGPDYTVAPDYCFDNNLGGKKFGYCRKAKNRHIPCDPQDVKCGKIYCVPRSSGRNPSCGYSAYRLVDHGTKCGDGKVCINSHCVDVQTAY